MAYKIITDTPANLPTEYVMEHNVGVLPFSYFIDGKEYRCEETGGFDGKEYYAQMRAGAKVTTSQINADSFIEYFTPFLKEGLDIIFVSISAGISGSFNSARLAKEDLEEEFPDRKIYLVDSKTAGLGEGLFVMKAVELRDQGVDVDTTYQTLVDICKNNCSLFTVDDLKYLRDGGRLSNAGAFVGTLLNIKPMLIGNPVGKIVSFEKIRGRKMAIKRMAEVYDKYVVNASEQVVGISSADCDADRDMLVELIQRNNPPKQIMMVEHEPATGAHVGPGMLAVFFWGTDDCREPK